MCYSRAGKSAEHKARSHRDVSDYVTEQSAENAFLGTVSKTTGTEAWHGMSMCLWRIKECASRWTWVLM